MTPEPEVTRKALSDSDWHENISTVFSRYTIGIGLAPDTTKIHVEANQKHQQQQQQPPLQLKNSNQNQQQQTATTTTTNLERFEYDSIDF